MNVEASFDVARRENALTVPVTALLTERDIDDFDARLPEFHGRVRRDDWVTQARELHLSKYGERP